MTKGRIAHMLYSPAHDGYYIDTWKGTPMFGPTAVATKYTEDKAGSAAYKFIADKGITLEVRTIRLAIKEK